MQTVSLGRLFIRIDRSVTGKKLEKLGGDVYEVANSALKELSGKIQISNLGVTVRVREGSVEIVVIIIGVLIKLKDILESLRALITAVRDVVKFIREKIKKHKQLKDAQIQSSRITTGHLTQFNRIYRQVELGEISYEEALEEAIRVLERIFEKIGEDVAEPLRSFYKSIRVPAGPVKPKPARPARPSRPYRRRTYGPGIEIKRAPGETETTSRPLPATRIG